MSKADLPVVGDKASVDHRFTQDDINAFAHLTGDDNPVHLDPVAAAEMGFDGTIVHGLLASALISRLLGTELPGPGTIYLGQELRFKRPIRPGELVTATVEVTSSRQDKPIFELRTSVTAAGETAIDGTATILLRRL